MAEATTTTNAVYDFTGDLIEACSCFSPCQCWVPMIQTEGRVGAGKSAFT